MKIATFQQLLRLGMHDAFRPFDQAPSLSSWGADRMLAFRSEMR